MFVDTSSAAINQFVRTTVVQEHFGNGLNCIVQVMPHSDTNPSYVTRRTGKASFVDLLFTQNQGGGGSSSYKRLRASLPTIAYPPPSPSSRPTPSGLA